LTNNVIQNYVLKNCLNFYIWSK